MVAVAADSRHVLLVQLIQPTFAERRAQPKKTTIDKAADDVCILVEQVRVDQCRRLEATLDSITSVVCASDWHYRYLLLTNQLNVTLSKQQRQQRSVYHGKSNVSQA